ncbi:MAG: glutamate synthase-related protein, partial [Bacillota bacterium]|nr:glutamate synthase-related protein [Bacillota bacterium]
MKNWRNIIKWPEATGLSIAALTSVIASYYSALYLVRTGIKKVSNKITYRIMTDTYDENMWELVHAANRIGPQVIVETNLRSEEGKIILRPLGTAKKFPDFSNLMFDMAQLRKLPTLKEQPVNTKVILGMKAAKPLTIDIPILISGMAYGLALSAEAKIALAKGASQVGTASNSGEGAFLQAERDAAKKFIIQYPR